MAIEEKIAEFETAVFANEGIKPDLDVLRFLGTLPYHPIVASFGAGGKVRGLTIFLHIDRVIEDWLCESDDATSIYDLPRKFWPNIRNETNVIWLDLVAGIDRPSKYHAVKSAVDLLERKKLAISRFVWVDWFPVMRGTHQMLWCRVRLAGG
jgi:hypothetical protein